MSRPPQRFVIRRISIGAKTNLPWTLTDTHRPNHIGRHPSLTTALAEADSEGIRSACHASDEIRARKLQHLPRPIQPRRAHD